MQYKSPSGYSFVFRVIQAACNTAWYVTQEDWNNQRSSRFRFIDQPYLLCSFTENMDGRIALAFVLCSLFVITGTWPLEPSKQLPKDHHQKGKKILYTICFQFHLGFKKGFLSSTYWALITIYCNRFYYKLSLNLSKLCSIISPFSWNFISCLNFLIPN